MTRRSSTRRVCLSAVAMLVLSGCSSGPGRSTALPPRTPEFAVATAEYRFEHAAEASVGRTVFRARNAGASDHELTLVQLGPNQSVTTPTTASPNRQVLATVVILNMPPGDQEVFAVDLLPGRYGFICFTRDPDGVQHATKGMVSEFTVRE